MREELKRKYEEYYWKLINNGVETTCGLISLTRHLKTEILSKELKYAIDFLININDYEIAKNIIGDRAILELTPLKNLTERAIWFSGLPHASIEDLIIATILNNKPYIELIKKLTRGNNYINWVWVKTIAERLNKWKDLLKILELNS